MKFQYADELRKIAKWYYFDVPMIHDELPADITVRCPFCGEPSLKHVVDEGTLADSPQVHYLHKFLLSADPDFNMVMVLTDPFKGPCVAE